VAARGGAAGVAPEAGVGAGGAGWRRRWWCGGGGGRRGATWLVVLRAAFLAGSPGPGAAEGVLGFFLKLASRVQQLAEMAGSNGVA
jgi:hypothetical protein